MKYKISKVKLWLSYILQGTASLTLSMGAVTNIVKTETALTNANDLGYSENNLLPLAIVLLSGVIFYAISKTTILDTVIFGSNVNRISSSRG